MRRKIISTHIFVNQRLHTAALERLLQAGADGVEIFCAKQSFDYSNRAQLEGLSAWFRQHPGALHSLHSPMYCDDCWGRTGEPPVNIADLDRRRRLQALDEIQHALEFAERVPFRYLVQHIGVGNEDFDERKQDAAFSSLERLRVIAKQLGVTILVENIPNGLSTPQRLMDFLRHTHLDDVGVCFDVGHAHISADQYGGGGVQESWEILKPRVRSTHIHDNTGTRDDHLWPGEGSVNWRDFMSAASPVAELPWLMEIRELPEADGTFSAVTSAFKRLSQWAEDGA